MDTFRLLEQSTVSQTAFDSTALGPMHSDNYSPRTSQNRFVQFEYFYDAGQLLGVPLERLEEYQPSEWESEEVLRVPMTSKGRATPKMTFRIQVQGCPPFSMQKNVLCQRNGYLHPISVGKAAECAVAVVKLWLDEPSNPARFFWRYLRLDRLAQIGSSLQIHLARGPVIPGSPSLRCCVGQASRDPGTGAASAEPSLIPLAQPPQNLAAGQHIAAPPRQEPFDPPRLGPPRPLWAPLRGPLGVRPEQQSGYLPLAVNIVPNGDTRLPSPDALSNTGRRRRGDYSRSTARARPYDAPTWRATR